MTSSPYLSEHRVGDTQLESCRRTDGTVLLRTPDIFPVNARDWHGPYPTIEAALADYRDRVALPRLTRADLTRLKAHGYYGVVEGVPKIMSRCRWTGGSILTPFEFAGPEGAA